MKTVGILSFEQFQGRKEIGSSRIRGKWLVKNWPEAEMFVQGQKYEVVIYQKAYFLDHAKLFKGIKILDLCDPDFQHWAYKVKEMIDLCDAVTTSTEALAEAVRQFTDKPVICIPDRVDLEEVNLKKEHKGDAKWVVWYGYSNNFDILKPVLHFLKKMGLNLIVISDGGFSMPIGFESVELKNFPYNQKTIYEDILQGDMVVNPRSEKGKWKYKSNNKTIQAWALGMPVATNVEELERFMSEEERNKEAVIRHQEVADKWDVRYSVSEYKNLINQLIEKKNANS